MATRKEGLLSSPAQRRHRNLTSSSVYQVAWVKVDTQTILTIGSHLITRDYQISLTQSDGRVWNLRISSVDRTDTGWYMCQINTDPMLSQLGYLEVVGECSNRLKQINADLIKYRLFQAVFPSIAHFHHQL